MNGQENEIMDLSEIIEMARQAGFRYTGNFSVDKGESLSCFQADLEAFAKLVAAKEREACAQIGDGFHDDEANCGDLIRAKGGEA